MVVYADSLKLAAKNNHDIIYSDMILATAYIHTMQEAKAIEVIQEAHRLAENQDYWKIKSWLCFI